jgi:AcrR family transcriptional regulator
MKKVKNIILREGFRSVSIDGIKSFTVENLASKLAMSKKTIYQYFPKKEVLIKKIIDFRMKKLTNEFNEIINEEEDAIIQFIKIREHNIKFANKFNLQKLTYLKARYPDIWKIIEKYRLDRKNIYKQIFIMAKNQGYLRENLDPEVCVALYINIFNSTFQPEFMNDNNLSIDLTINHLQEILSNGFFNKSGTKKMKEYNNIKLTTSK